MSDADIISRTVSQYIFERTPPYREEQIKRALNEEVEVDYQLKKVENQMKVVSRNNDIEKYNNTQREEDPQIDLSGPLDKEQLVEKVIQMRDSIKDFDNYSPEQKNQVIADIINGSYDNIIFDN